MSSNDSSVLHYLSEINKVPLLSREEEYKLAKDARNGVESAKQKLVSSNLRFVVQMAKRYTNSNLDLLDLISEGNLGLIRAVESFDPDRGFHFISYAVHWIKQSIIKAISEKSKIVRIPLNLNNTLSHIERSFRENHQGEINDRTIEAVSEEVSMNKKDVLNLIEVTRSHSSLEKPHTDDSGKKQLSNMLPDDKMALPEENVIENNLKSDINRLLQCLTAQEADVVEYRFGLNGKKPMTLLEIGKMKNLTKERIRQIEKKALTNLQETQHTEKLNEYVMV